MGADGHGSGPREDDLADVARPSEVAQPALGLRHREHRPRQRLQPALAHLGHELAQPDSE